jgi:hypothetical protein
MLTRGAKHQGGVAVPPIRVGVGGHRPRRTSQHALSRQSEHARGTLNTLRSCGDSPSPNLSCGSISQPSPRKRGEGTAISPATSAAMRTAHAVQAVAAARDFALAGAGANKKGVTWEV